MVLHGNNTGRFRYVPFKEDATDGREQGGLAELVTLSEDVDPVDEACKDDGVGELAEVFETQRTDLHRVSAASRMCRT